jgi:hypothetical protein
MSSCYCIVCFKTLAQTESKVTMKTILAATACLLIAACASYREVARASIANEVVLAEFHEGGMTIGQVSDPLSIANWELRIGANGAVEQRLYDESAGVWRIFEGPPLGESELTSIVSECETLPLAASTSTQVTLGRIASDTTYLRIVLHLSAGTRDVVAFAPKASSPEFAQFLRIWKRIARHRPVPQSPGGWWALH